MQPELTKGNIQMPKIKANKRNNQTCHLMIKGLIENINNIKRYQKKFRPLNVSSHWSYYPMERSIPTLAHVRIDSEKEKNAARKRHTWILSSRKRLRRKSLWMRICPENKEFLIFWTPKNFIKGEKIRNSDFSDPHFLYKNMN